MDKNDPKQFNQCLKDANCNQQFIEEFNACEQIEKELRLLEMHRKNLLDQLHESQKHIDCIDYLIYQLKKQKKV